MRFEKMEDLHKIGMPVLPGVKEQIDFSKSYLAHRDRT